MKKVNSTAISAIGYNPFFTTIVFNHGNKYRYYGVRYSTYRMMKNADSVGRAYNSLIKGKFRGRKVA